MKKIYGGMCAMLLTLLPSAVLAQGPAPSPASATDVPKADLDAVFATLNGGIEKQVRVVDIGNDTNVAVGVLYRGGMQTDGDVVGAILHHQVTEVYYVVSGSGILVTGGTATGDSREFPADSPVVTELVGPSGSRQIVDGQTRRISAGDVVVIPAGVAHGFRHIDDGITYLSIRVDPEQALPAGYVNPVLQ